MQTSDVSLPMPLCAHHASAISGFMYELVLRASVLRTGLHRFSARYDRGSLSSMLLISQSPSRIPALTWMMLAVLEVFGSWSALHGVAT